MGVAKLYSQSGGGTKLNGIIKDYYVYAGEKVSTGDFVEFINGVASQQPATLVDTAVDNTTTHTAYFMSALALDDHRVLITHCHSTTYRLFGTVCTIKDGIITPQTDVAIDNSNTVHSVKSVLLPNGNVFVSYEANNYNNMLCRICTLNDTHITSVGTMVNIGNYSPGYSPVVLSNGNVFLAYSANSSNYYLYGTICTISGTTITAGTSTTLSNTKRSGYYMEALSITDTSIFIAHSSVSTNYYLYGMVVSISGTTVTAQSDTALNEGMYTSRALSMDKIDTNKFFISHEYDGDLYGIVCSVSGTTVTKGTDTQIFNYVHTADSSTLTLATNRVLIVGINNTTDYKMFGVICDINDTTISKYTPIIMNSDAYTGWKTSTVLMNDLIFVAHSHTQNSYYLYAQMFGIVNNQPSSQAMINIYETQVRKARTSSINGVAKTSGEGGDGTEHNQQVNIYVPSL